MRSPYAGTSRFKFTGSVIGDRLSVKACRKADPGTPERARLCVWALRAVNVPRAGTSLLR
jgi:hypothetical protein